MAIMISAAFLILVAIFKVIIWRKKMLKRKIETKKIPVIKVEGTFYRNLFFFSMRL